MSEQQARRRSVIIGAAGVGALAACSSPPVPGAAQTPLQSSPTPSSSGSTPAETSSSPGGAGGTPTSEVPVGGGTIYADKKVVVTQPAAGTFKAYDTTCPHQGCAVATVSDGKITCPCHGSAFNIATGDVVTGPATSGLTAKQITVTGDTFTIA